MALYQPTNIIPSSFTDGVVDASRDVARISWQVNGNSAMTAYQIDFYQNDFDSTPITDASTGKITNDIPVGGFYGTDRFGQPKMFTWSAGNTTTWNAYNSQFTNGNEYKFKLAQWYAGQDRVVKSRMEAFQLNKGTNYYFQDDTAVVVFTVSESRYALNDYVYYSYNTGNVWIITNLNRFILCNGYRIADGSAPSGAQQLPREGEKETLDDVFVSQIESNVFITRDTPTLNIQRCNNDQFLEPKPFASGSTLSSSVGYFVGEYKQVQGAPVREVRWQIAQWVNGAPGEILADTGNIDTPTLQYSFNGFFIGSSYAVRCFGKADYQTYGTQDFDSGWTNFIVQVSAEQQGTYTGDFSVQCVPGGNAALLRWDGVEAVPPTTTPTEFKPVVDGTVTLPPQKNKQDYSVTWKQQNQDPMSFPAPWTAAWTGKNNLFSLANDIGWGTRRTPTAAAFSPDGRIYVLAGVEDRAGVATVFAIDGVNVTSSKEIQTLDGYSFGSSISAVVFSPDSKTLIIVGSNTYGTQGFSYVFSVGQSDPTNVTFVAPIYKQEQIFKAFDAAFTHDGTKLVLGGVSGAAIFSVSGTSITYLSDIGALTDVRHIAFNDQDTLIALTGTFSGYAKVGSFDGTTVTRLTSVEWGSLSMPQTIRGQAYPVFCPGTNTLVLAGNVYGDYSVIAVILNVTGSPRLLRMSFQSAIMNVSENDQGVSAAFSPDGYWLVIGALDFIMPRAHVYSFNKSSSVPETVPASATLYATLKPVSDEQNFTTACSFSPNGKVLACGGSLYSCYIGKIFEIQQQDGSALSISEDTLDTISLKKDEQTLATFTSRTTRKKCTMILTQTAFYFYDSGVSLSKTVGYTQQEIKSVTIYGGECGTTVDCVSVYKGAGDNVLPLYQTFDFEPNWNDNTYQLYMSANFNNSLEGGTGTVSGAGFRIYRQEIGSNILTPIATLPSTATSLIDYGIRSRKSYKYSLYVYDNSQAFMQSVENDTIIATCFKNYSLLVCDYDSANDAYHVRKQYIFALNLSEGNVGNNNSPTLNANFTPYPTRMQSTQNYASGTLQGLIGAIYTVPALIEQIGGIKHTAKASTLDYFDSVDLEKELYDLSVAPYQLFLRDMKGHLRMIATNGQISMSTDLKKRQIPLTISFSWVEIGDASDVTIIQTPDDYGWNNDNQVLDVNLDVDPLSGVLSAKYPKPYEGTRFYLTGVNKEILGAKTPNGITPARFVLSKTATEPDDGVLRATVRTNIEENS